MKKKLEYSMIISLIINLMAVSFFLFPFFGNKQKTYAEQDEYGNIVIKSADLSKDKVSFLYINEDSKIELLAILGENGEVKVSFGTCQSCNGSPYAYYVQKGSLLVCNNCGQSFPVSEVGESAGGCHPIPIPEEIITRTEDGIILDTEALMKAEELFEKVIAH